MPTGPARAGLCFCVQPGEERRDLPSIPGWATIQTVNDPLTLNDNHTMTDSTTVTPPPAPAADKRPLARWTQPALLAVLLVAAYLRIHDLNAQGLWGDEGWSIWLARGDTLRDLTMTMVADHHGPVYSILLRGWEMIAGPSVLALRMITVLFSLASIALIARLGRALFTPAAGVGAALAFALMDKHVVLTQEVRDYPMVFFTMILIALFYVRWRQSPGGGHAFGFVAASVAGLYLHYYCFMVNLAILAHAVLTLDDRRRWRHFLAQNVLIGVAFLPWTWIVVYQFVNTPVDSEVLNIHGMPFNRATLSYLASETLGRPLALYGLLALTGWLGPLVRTPGIMSRQPRRDRLVGVLLPVLWFSVPVIITWALHSRYPLLTDRNISVIMPAVALLVGLGLTAFPRFSASWIVALVVIINLTTTSAFYRKPPWREMAAAMAARYPGGEPVLLDVEGAHAALWYHTLLVLPGADLDATLNRLPGEADEPIVSLYDYRKRYREDFIPQLQRRLDGVPGLWLAYWGDPAKKHDVFDLLEAEGFTRTATLQFQHLGNPIFAYRYDRQSALDDVIAAFAAADDDPAFRVHRAAWPDSASPGDTLNVLLWWSAADVPREDLTVSVFLLGPEGVLRAQHDGYPAGGQRPTSTWQPGEIIFDAHAIALPGDLPPGTYHVGVKLYRWWDGSIVPAAGDGEYVTLGTVDIR